MNEQHEAHISDSPFHNTNRQTRVGSALDKAFPSPWILGGLVFLVVLLSVLSGWKIVNLERERAVLESEQQLFAMKVIEELPYRVISERTGIPVTTLYYQYQQILRIIENNNELREYWEEIKM